MQEEIFGGDGNTIIIVLLLLLIEHRIRALFSQKKKTRAQHLLLLRFFTLSLSKTLFPWWCQNVDFGLSSSLLLFW